MGSWQPGGSRGPCSFGVWIHLILAWNAPHCDNEAITPAETPPCLDEPFTSCILHPVSASYAHSAHHHLPYYTVYHRPLSWGKDPSGLQWHSSWSARSRPSCSGYSFTAMRALLTEHPQVTVPCFSSSEACPSLRDLWACHAAF